MVASLTGASLLAGPDGFSRAAVGRSLSLLGSCRGLQRDENIRQHATRGERWPAPLCRHTFTAEITNRADALQTRRFSPLRNPVCPPVARRRPFPSTTGCFQSKPLLAIHSD